MTTWPSDSDICAVAIPLIQKFEGFCAAPYLDATGVIPTIGYGTTCYPDGRKVSMHDAPIDEKTAQMLLECHLDDLIDKLKSPGALMQVPTVNQAAAFLSLSYNIGIGAFASSTVRKEFDLGDLAAAAAAFLLWDKARVNGELVAVPGLAERRQAEKSLFEAIPCTA